MDNGSPVWYASYGSNLSRERFLCYIQGGLARGALSACEGARDRTPPSGDRPITIHHPLYFAWESRVWHGGVAFLGHEHDRRHVTLGRMYRITMTQLEDVLAQENGIDALPIDCDISEMGRPIPYLESKYGCLLQLGQVDGVPILSFTSNEDIAAHPLNPPGIDYLCMMADGLRECYGMNHDRLVEYFAHKPGIAGRLDEGTLREWLQR